MFADGRRLAIVVYSVDEWAFGFVLVLMGFYWNNSMAFLGWFLDSGYSLNLPVIHRFPQILSILMHFHR